MGPALNLFALLDQAATRFSDRGAVYLGERQLCTWLQLRERALRLATSIRQQGGAGARIAIASENRPEIIELMFAVWAAECVVVPMNYKLHPREMDQILEDAGVSLVFASPKIASQLASVVDIPLEIVGEESYDRRLAAAPSLPPQRTDPSTLAWLFYTSGTTGRSKGAMLSHRSLTAMTIAHLADIDAPDENCSLVHGAPMSHGSGLYIARTCCAARARWCPRRARSIPTSSWICAGTIRVPAPSWLRRWCSGWSRRAEAARASCARSFTAVAPCTSRA